MEEKINFDEKIKEKKVKIFFSKATCIRVISESKEKKIRSWCTGVSMMIPRRNNVSFLWLAGEPRICASFTLIMWKRLLHSGDPPRSEKERKILSRPFFFLRTIEDLRPRLAHGNVIRADVSVLDSSISPASQRNENFRKNRSNAAKISLPLSFALDCFLSW